MHMYRSFFIMTVAMTVLMYVLMFAGIDSIDHFYNSQGMIYMALLMGSSMAALMLGFMLHMYKDRRLNAIIAVASGLVFAGSFFLLRSQATIGDAAYLKMMIPHHSMALLSSERAQIADPRVRKLADQIIETQKREIAEMKSILEDAR